LISEEAKTAVAKRMKSPEFANTLAGMVPMGTEDDDSNPLSGQGVNSIIYDETDSSKTVGEEITDLMTRGVGTVSELTEEGEVCVGTDLSQFIGYEFSIQGATTAWMKWNAR